MASYKGVQGALLALEEFFKRRLPTDLSDEPTNAQAKLLGSADIHGRARFFSQQGASEDGRHPELPVNLHFLLIANANSATIEADLMGWAMVELANASQLDVSHVLDIDDEWGQTEILNITPDEMSTEDLMRIWDVFESPYTSTVPYVARTIRLRLNPQHTEGPAVVTRVFPGGTV